MNRKYNRHRMVGTVSVGWRQLISYYREGWIQRKLTPYCHSFFDPVPHHLT